MKHNELNEHLNIAVIQTSLDFQVAWSDDYSGKWESIVQMSEHEERQAKKEIRYFLSSLRGTSSQRRPDFILFPELSIPRGFERHLKKSAEKLESIVIAGSDYRIETGVGDATVVNEALVIVPRKIRGMKIGTRTQVRRVGKTYPAFGEKRRLDSIGPCGVKFKPDPLVWLFECGNLGNFAIAICYDFMDLDRIVMYRNRIQTLFVIAYNRDTSTFDHVAEALSRMVFCNVVICNCGKFGGSHVICPLRDPYKRTIYRKFGQELTSTQIVKLPLQKLVKHQSGEFSEEFKGLPPGYDKFNELLKKNRISSSYTES